MPNQKIVLPEDLRATNDAAHHWLPGISINWGNDGEVILVMSSLPEWVEEAPPGTHRDSLWARTVDRKQINEIIRTLRRARNTAYGSDE